MIAGGSQRNRSLYERVELATEMISRVGFVSRRRSGREPSSAARRAFEAIVMSGASERADGRCAAEDGSRPDRRLGTSPTWEIISVARSTRSASERTR